MKVLLINGSPHKDGCTNRALSEVAYALGTSGIDSEIVWIGTDAKHGCIACGGCKETKQCVFDDGVNEISEKLGKEIKLIAFRNILINAALCDSHINEREFYIKLLTDLTTDQIKVLHLFYLRDHKKEIEFTNVYKYISKHWCGVDESYRFALITELIRYGLISGSEKLKKVNGEGHHLTPFGERFILFIFNPNETENVTDIKNEEL